MEEAFGAIEFFIFFFRILNHHLCRFEIFIPMLRIIQKLLKLICHCCYISFLLFKLHVDIHVMIFFCRNSFIYVSFDLYIYLLI